MSKVSEQLFKHLATLGPVGYLPVAPGTFGTLVALVVVLLIRPTLMLHLLLLAVSVVLGVVASSEAERVLDRKDSQHIVIDEFAGYIVAIAFLPLSAGFLIAAFVLFRIFDIVKPPPIRGLQYLKGGTGVMADDIAAAHSACDGDVRAMAEHLAVSQRALRRRITALGL